MIAASLFIVVTVISIIHGRAIDSRQVTKHLNNSAPIAVDSYGNRVFLVREQRNPMAIYPHRAMMITGVYQPKHRASSRQATGVFAQGNAVSSDAFLGTDVPKYDQESPEAIGEPEISSAEAQAAPGPHETPIIDEKPSNPGVENNEEEFHDEKHIQTQQEDEPLQYSTEAPVTEVPIVPQKGIEKRPTKSNKPLNKGKKTKVHVNDDSDNDGDYEENDDDEEEDDEQPEIFNPFKSKRRGAILRNNFFPMVFSFPKSLGRQSSSGSSPPGMITAIANSYSTGKSGVASSVATAYGGSPNSKKKFQKSHQE